MAVNKITWEQVKDAPSLAEVVKKFDRTFGVDVMLSSYVGFADKKYLLEAYKTAGIKWRFDHHYFDVWSVCYAALAKKNKLTSKEDFAGFGVKSLMKKYNIKSNRLHDALEDCRVEAEVLRKVIKDLK
jgi:DNA polymerase III alpha subunit (gram-positive type)